MDREAQEAIEAGRTDLRSVEERLRSAIGSAASVLRAEVSSVEVKIHRQMREEGTTTRRHFAIVRDAA